MYRHKEKISFWIQLLSFSGSVMFLLYIAIFGQPRSEECKECVQKTLYYQHQADSLQQVIKEQKAFKHDAQTPR